LDLTLVAAGVVLLVLDPQQLQGEILVPLQLPIDLLQVGHGTGGGTGGGAREEAGLHIGIAEVIGKGPGETGGSDTTEIIRYRAG